MNDIKALADKFFPQGYPELAEQWLDFAEHVAAEREDQVRAEEREKVAGLVGLLEQIKQALGRHHFIESEPRSVGKAVKMAIGYKAGFLLENNVEWLEELDNFGDRAQRLLATYNDNRKG